MKTKQRNEDEYEKFREYYSSKLFLTNLFLPEKTSMHHFRFQLFSNNRFYRVRQTIKFKRELQDLVLKKRPKNIYFTPVKWLDSLNIKRKPTDCMLSSPLYFDIDSNILPTPEFHEAKKITCTLIDYIKSKYEREPSWVVFSGKRGFHVYYWDWDKIPKKFPKPEERIRVFKEERNKILKELSKEGILVDDSVTADPWRILRVPGTLHGETHLIALKVDNPKLFSLEKAQMKSKVPNL